MLRISATFIIVSCALWLIFSSAQWYADTAALPRYCDNPDTTVELVGRILKSGNPAGDENRRPYVIAAKLIFLVPRADDEPISAYQARLRERIAETCH